MPSTPATTSSATRTEDSVQVSLAALREIELQRIEDERHERERVQFEEVRRIAAAEAAEQQRRLEQQQALERAEAEERIRVEAARARVDMEERARQAEREARLETQRLALATRQAELEAAAIDLSGRRRVGWFPVLLALLVFVGQGLFIYHQHRENRAADARYHAVSGQLDELAEENKRLAAAARAPALTPSDRAAEDSAAKPSAVAKPTKPKPSKPRPRPKSATTDKGSKTPPNGGQIHLGCDPREPLCGAR